MNKSFLKQTFLYGLLSDYRAWKAGNALRLINVYPLELVEIIKDYRYSITKDYRTVMQVLNIESCIKHVKDNNIDGAFVETGTWTGGASAYALLSMKRNNICLTYWGFDSFEGMPDPTSDDDSQSISWAGDDPRKLNNADREACYTYLSETGYEVSKINLIKGWFDESLVMHKSKVGPIAILRLDGDFYESTKVPLLELYPQVVNGGIVIIDDYGTFEGCKKAIDEIVLGQDILYAENGVRYFVKKSN